MSTQLQHAPDFDALSGAAQEVLMQVFLVGPVWDGHVASKAGRDELRQAGYIDRWQGWQFINARGIALCTDQGTIQRIRNWGDKRFYKKATT